MARVIGRLGALFSFSAHLDSLVHNFEVTQAMSDPYFNNEFMLAAMGTFTGPDTSFTDAEQAFLQTRGDFQAKFTAALRVITIAKLKPEKFFAIPEDLESLSKQELVDLVPPDGGVFVRSNASKDDLRDALRSISRRQRERPYWTPRTPDSVLDPTQADQEPEKEPPSAFETVPGSLAGLPEIGTIATQVPAWYGDPVYVAGDESGPALQLMILAALGIGPDTMPERTIIAEDPFPSPFLVISTEGDTGALQGAEQLVDLSVEDGPSAVIELLATTRTLGGVPVTDETAEDAIGVLLNAHDWWHSPAIVMDVHSPFGDGAQRTIVRASSAEWVNTNEGRVGFIVLVNVASGDSDGFVAAGVGALHQFSLWWEASGVHEPATHGGTWHRLVQHCTGGDSCLRNGCPASRAPEVDWLATQVASEAAVIASMLTAGDWATNAYLRALANPDDASVYEEQGGVMWIAEGILEGLGWLPVGRSSWDIGDQDLLLYRSGHVLLVRHHATHRELSVSDGMEELATIRDMLEEDEEPGNAGEEQSAMPADTDRDAQTEAALDECLRLLKADEITPLNGLQYRSTPLLCLWPWGDGQPHTEHSHERIRTWLEKWLPSLPGIS